MARSELPDNWQDLAAGYVLDNLSDEEMASWKNLLNTHPELSHELEELQASFNQLANAIPLYQPPNHLLGQIQAAAQTSTEHAEIQSLETQSLEIQPLALPHQTPDDFSTNAVTQSQPKSSDVKLFPLRDQHFNRWLRLGGAIAAGCIALLGFQIYSLNAQLRQANATIQALERDLQITQAQTQAIRPVVNTLQQPETLIYSLHGSNLANTASGRLVLSHEREVTILVQNLPELPTGKVYRLWAALPSKTALTYCGQFNSNLQGVIQLTPSTRECSEQPTQMIITVDAATDPTTQGGPVVMQGQI